MIYDKNKEGTVTKYKQSRVLSNYLRLAVVMGAGLSACSTQPGTILNHFSLDDGQGITTDSRQRIVVANTLLRNTSRPGLANPERIVCAEPSPDVAIALANSFGFGVSVLGSGSGAVSASTAEGIAQLGERTATIQLLRDQMYRACEAYANGAITGTTYSLIMSKNNNAMVTLLLGETTGGAFGRKLASVGSGTNADVSASQKISSPGQGSGTKAPNGSASGSEEAGPGTDTTVKTAANTTATSGGDITSRTPLSDAAANALKDMQAAFLDTNFSEQVVATCLVELGMEPDVSQEEEKAFNTTLRQKQNARRYTGYTYDPGDGGPLVPTTQQQRDIEALQLKELSTEYNELAVRNHRSKLAKFCEANLWRFMATAQQNDFRLKSLGLEVERIKAELADDAAKLAAKTQTKTTKSTDTTGETPVKSTVKTGETPAKSADKTVGTPAKSADKTVGTPAKSADKTGETPAKSADKTAETPAKPADKTAETPATAPIKPDQGAAQKPQ